MTNGLIFIALGCVLALGAWAIFISVELDKALAVIKKQKAEIARLVEPPF